ncbi:MAG: hypothetical protein JW939_04200 [Candidatus Thermoplasmatota archaeon]|nr:hypothetical protein [Candidatus Thermoplasmatota archaeon]
MHRGMEDSYRRTYDLLKAHKTSVLMICAALYVIFFCMMMAQQFVFFIIYGIMGLGGLAILGGAILATLGGGLTILGIVVILIGIFILFIMFLVMIAFIVAAGSFNFGLQIFIAQLLLKLRTGIKLDWKDIWGELKGDWRHLIGQGIRLFLRYIGLALVIILPIYLIMGVIIAVLVVPQVLGASPVLTMALTVFANLALVVIYLPFILIVYPVLLFVFEAAAVRMAEGKTAGKAVMHGLKDIRYNRRGVLYFVLGYLAVNLAAMIFFPIAFLLGPLLPLLTKSYFLANRDLFYE